MSEKTGLSHILEHRRHPPLVGQWPGMVLPWTLIAAVAVIAPVSSAIKRGETAEPRRGVGARVEQECAGPSLVRLVVGHGESGDLLLVGRGQAQLLHAVPARHGPLDRCGLAEPGASGSRR